MSDDGRLELDEDGRLVDASGDRVVELVDLADPDAVEELAPSRVRPWVDAHVAPWVRRHRRGVVAAGLAVAVALGAGTWIVTRPPYVAPTVALELHDAILEGTGLGGPQITTQDTLSVAYTARALTPGDTVEVLGLSGPGLLGARSSAQVTSAERSYLVLDAQVECRDPAIAAAMPSSYALSVRRTAEDGDVLETLTPLGTATTALDLAVAGHCLEQRAAADLVVQPGVVTARPGVPTAELSLLVRNTGPVPLAVAAERRPTAGLEVDQSSTVTIPSGGEASLATRVLVHDCSSTPALPSLAELPNPVPWAASSAPGVALHVGLGRATTLASYPVDADALGRELRSTVCAGAPAVSASLESVDGARASDGSWVVQGVYRMRTEGVRVRVGREHFAGPAAGEGSILSTPDTLVPGVVWNLAPTALDGGAGRITVSFTGSSCADLAATTPTTLALGITMADRTVYSFELPVDDLRLARAAYRACGTTPTVPLEQSGWRTGRTITTS